MTDLRDHIRGDEDPMQRWLDWVPGFKGYRDREQRRDADRLVRQYLAGQLAECQARVRTLHGNLARDAKLGQMTALDSLEKRFEKLADLLRYADSGYSGWFDAVKIREQELDKLYAYDVSLKQFIGDVEAAVTALAEAPEAELPAALDKVAASLGELEHMIRNREQVAMELVP
jgi:predicted aminopeptidase